MKQTTGFYATALIQTNQGVVKISKIDPKKHAILVTKDTSRTDRHYTHDFEIIKIDPTSTTTIADRARGCRIVSAESTLKIHDNQIPLVYPTNQTEEMELYRIQFNDDEEFMDDHYIQVWGKESGTPMYALHVK